MKISTSKHNTSAYFAHLSGRAGVTVSLSTGKVTEIRPGWSRPSLSGAVADDASSAMTGGEPYDVDSAIMYDIDADDNDDRDDTDDQVEEQLVTLLDTFLL